MKKKTKIIIVASAIALILLAVIAVIFVTNSTKKAEKSEDEFEVWREKPFIYEGETDTEKTYSSYEELFDSAFSSLQFELKSESGEVLSIYETNTSGTPTAIFSYRTADGKIKFLVCKYVENKLVKTYIETDSTEINPQNDLIIVKNSDIIAVRTGLETENGRQVIYDFYEGSYAAVKDNLYEYPNEDEMNSTLANYNPSAIDYVSFYEETKAE